LIIVSVLQFWKKIALSKSHGSCGFASSHIEHMSVKSIERTSHSMGHFQPQKGSYDCHNQGQKDENHIHRRLLFLNEIKENIIRRESSGCSQHSEFPKEIQDRDIENTIHDHGYSKRVPNEGQLKFGVDERFPPTVPHFRHLVYCIGVLRQILDKTSILNKLFKFRELQ